MRILVGVDESEFVEDILRAIVSQFRTENTEILVLHVLEPVGPAPPQMDPGYAPELEGQRMPAHALVERIAKELQSAGFKANTAVEVGDIRERIIDYAEGWRADDRHGFAWAQRRPAFSAWKWGRVRRSPCEVFRRDRSQVTDWAFLNSTAVSRRRNHSGFERWSPRIIGATIL